AIKDFALEVSSGIAGRVMQSRTAQNGPASDFDQNFNSKFAPADGKIALLPLLLKDKISALIYADGGAQAGALDVAALHVLVRATGAWLEVISQRKQAQKDGPPEPEMQAASPANDPFAAHAPLHTAKAQSLPESEPAIAMSAAASS